MKETIYKLLDKLMNIVVISLILIIGSLPIVTILPTFSALLGTLYFFNKEKKWSSYPEAFKHYFKRYFKQSFLCQLLLMTVFFIGKMNLSLLVTLPPTLKLMIYAMTLFFSGLILLLVLNTMFSFLIYPNESLLERLRVALLITIIKLPYSFLLLMLILVGSFLVLLAPPLIILVLGSVFSLYIAIEKNVWKEFSYQGNSIKGD